METQDVSISLRGKKWMNFNWVKDKLMDWWSEKWTNKVNEFLKSPFLIEEDLMTNR